MSDLDTWFPRGLALPLAGGLTIGLGVLLLHAVTGRVGGMSTFFTATLSWFSRLPYLRQARFTGSRAWRLQYAAGLVVGALAWRLTLGRDVVLPALASNATDAATLLVGGAIAGYGARWSGGCTSGHGICGMGSLQPRSIVAVLVFLATAVATAVLAPRLGWPR